MIVNYSKRDFFNLFLEFPGFDYASYLVGEEKLMWHHYRIRSYRIIYVVDFLIESSFKKYFKITSQKSFVWTKNKR